MSKPDQRLRKVSRVLVAVRGWLDGEFGAGGAMTDEQAR